MSRTFLRGWSNYLNSWNHLGTWNEVQKMNAYGTFITRGNGHSYGDSAQNSNGLVIYDKSIPHENQLDVTLDIQNRYIDVNATATIQEVNDYLEQFSLMLPVVPSAKASTIGGCIACDCHGKNHHVRGSFGDNVIAITICSEIDKAKFKTPIDCTPLQNSKLFFATIGGMGLTGHILAARLKVVHKIETFRQEKTKHYSVDGLLDYMNEIRHTENYALAWFDLSKKHFKALLYNSYALNVIGLNVKPRQDIGILPYFVPFLNRITIQVLKRLQFAARQKSKLMHPNSIYFPSDTFSNFNKWFGKKGFIEFQFSISDANRDILKYIFDDISKNFQVYLAGIKILESDSSGLLSFCQKGWSVALDFKYSDDLILKLHNYTSILIKNGGKVYLAKDVTLNEEEFKSMYGNFYKFQSIRDEYNFHNFQSNFSRRVNL